jgi:hypothetical protein
MPALAKQALSENGISPRPSSNGKSAALSKGDPWSEAQDVALVQVNLLITETLKNLSSGLQMLTTPNPQQGAH